MIYRVLVCGGRNFSDWTGVRNVLDDLFHCVPTVMCHGGATGADTLAGDWAKLRGIQVTPFPANWKEYGKSAGAIRNQQMLTEFKPNVVVAFPGGKGTEDMTKRARGAGIMTVKPYRGLWE